MLCAIYARYSTDMQSPASIEDQVRNCREFAGRKGWQVLDAHIYSDRAVSGAAREGRQSFERLVAKALSPLRDFDVILVDDTSRLSRDIIDQVSVFRQLKFHGVNLIYVSQGIDSQHEDAETLIAVHGLVDSLYVKELAKKTHRGLTGKVLNKMSAGGKVFGYRTRTVPDPSGRLDERGQPLVLGYEIDIDPAEAEVVRDIFNWFVEGTSLRHIALRLNEKGVPHPWKGRKRDAGGWATSSARAILVNEKYAGQWFWNKTRWVKYPGSNKRKCLPRPREEWIGVAREDLRIIDAGLWDKARAHQEQVAKVYQRGPAGALAGQKRQTAYSQHLLSGLLRCGICGGNMIITGRNHYGCTNHRNKGDSVCSNSRGVKRSELEAKVVAALRDQVLDSHAGATIVERALAHIRETEGGNARMAVLQEEEKETRVRVENLVGFIAKGQQSAAVTDALQQAEMCLSRLRMEIKAHSGRAESFQAPSSAELSRLLENLQGLLAGDAVRARQALHALIGRIELTPNTGNSFKYQAKIQGDLAVALSTAGGSGDWI